MSAQNADATMAVFLDLENIALGARDAGYPKFAIQKVLERLLVKGHIVVKKAYCDFDRYRDFKRDLHEAAFELIEIPHVRMSGKNSADIRMVVDALDLCYMKGHVDTFAIISGDSDFSPLVSKLRENAKTVIGVGVKNSTSDLFINNCDEFIYYDDLVRVAPPRTRRSSNGTATMTTRDAPAAASEDALTVRPAPRSRSRRRPSPAVASAMVEAPSADVAVVAASDDQSTTPPPEEQPTPRPPIRRRRPSRAKASVAPVSTQGSPTKESSSEISAPVVASEDSATESNDGPSPEKAFELLATTLEVLGQERGDKAVWGSMIKRAMKRQNPGFNERAYGFRSFSDLLSEGQKRGVLKLTSDEKSGDYTVEAVE